MTKKKAPEEYAKMGAPTKYKPEYCQFAIDAGKQGKSKVWIAASLDVTPNTLDNWAEANPDFLRALARAKTLEQLWWEDIGQSSLLMPQGQTFSQSAWSRSMAARFQDWRERSEVKHDATAGFAGLLGSLTGNVFPKADEQETE